MLALAVVARMAGSGEVPWAAPDAPEWPVSPLRDLGLGLAVGAALVAAWRGLTEWLPRGDEAARSLARSLGPLSTADARLLAVASGLAEEAFFRGALLPWVGLWGAALLFGALHFVPERAFWPWTAFAVVAGVAFGGHFLFTGHLLAPVTAHVLVNAVNLPWIVARYADADR